MIKHTLFFTTALVIAGPAFAQVMPPAEYVATAGASDLFEIQSAQIVLESTKDPKIRSFAQMMIADHGTSTTDVKAAATQAGISAPPPALMPAQTKHLAELKAESGPTRDAAYVTQQKEAHNQALAMQQAYAKEGSAPSLKAAAAKIVPVVEHHIEMLKTM